LYNLNQVFLILFEILHNLVSSINYYNNFISYLNNLLVNFCILIIIYSLISYIKLSLHLFLILCAILWNFIFESQDILINFLSGYFKIHPAILYATVLLFFYKLFQLKKFTLINFNFLLIFAISAFILGSLWALYQNVWGFYWSNDLIEISLIIFILILVYNLHSNKQEKKQYLNFFIIINIFFLLALRLNLVYTRHNFFNIKIKLSVCTQTISILLLNIFFFIKKMNKHLIFSKKMSSLFLFYFIFLIFNLNSIIIYKNISLILLNLYINLAFITIIKIRLKKIIHMFILSFLIIFINFYVIYLKIPLNCAHVPTSLNNLYFNTKLSPNKYLLKPAYNALYSGLNNNSTIKLLNEFSVKWDNYVKILNIY
jgi:hypothetical protein